MSLTVTQRPSQTIDGSPSTWNAVGNPILYRMQRKDYLFNQSNNNGGFAQLQFTGVDISSSFTVDDSVYYNTYGFATVTASIFSGGDTLVTLTSPYTTSSTGFVNNITSRPSYRVEIEVYNLSDEQIGDAEFIYSPNPRGVLTVDISAILRTALIADNDADLTDGDEVFDDTSAYTGFYIKYLEVWTGSAESPVDDSANEFYAVLGARQIPSLYGGNMGGYAIDIDADLVSFLTRFERPVMWVGYPFLMGIIINEDVSNDVYLIANSDNSTPSNESGKLVQFDVNEILTDQTVSEFEITVMQDGSISDPEYSQTLTVELREACNNPIMLLGRNSLGGPLQWLFDGSQEYDFDYGNNIKAKRLVLVAENLSINDWETLQDFITLGEVYRNNIVEFDSTVIKTSTKVGQQVYVVDTDGNKTGVIVISTKNKTQTRNLKHRFEIEIEYPEVFVA